MDQLAREDIAAAAAAHQELGPHFDGAVAESLVDRIGAEIDKRVDARIGDVGAKPAKPARRPADGAHATPVNWPTTVLALGSMGLGVGVTAIVLTTNGPSHPSSGQVFLALVIWIILGAINVAYARRR
jgi:hypothetical protein